MRLLLSLCLLAPLYAAAPEPLPVLIISGRNNHDWRTTTPYLRGVLAASGRFDVRVVEEPAGMTAATLALYRALVLDYNGPRWGGTAEAAVEEFVRSGKGLVVVHGASYAFGEREVLGDRHRRTGLREPPWPAFAKMTGAYWTEKPRSGHAPRHIFRVKFTGSHPISAGMGEGFEISDELYHFLRLSPDIRVLARAFDDPANGGTGKDEPVLWTLDYGKGRVFHTTLGHDVAAMTEPGFSVTFARGTEWAATGEVTLPPTLPPAADKDAVRVLVVTGGHAYPPSFDGVFEGLRELAVTVNPHPIAYRRDLRKRFDALVLYDSIKDLDEPQRKNLRDFVEAGKGVVVLHHAIVDFAQTWPWWYEEVVGGRYLPTSTFKHNQHLSVTVTEKHAVTRGVAPMRIIDETYKGMWISPAVKVLMKTDHPTADGPVVWVSPYEKSRVVYIKLGHGREAHEHPGYRQLVRNAILWSAGRLK